LKNPSHTHTHTHTHTNNNKPGGVAQGVGPEFKSYYFEKKNKPDEFG
jgi:hypothetical protein